MQNAKCKIENSVFGVLSTCVRCPEGIIAYGGAGRRMEILNDIDITSVEPQYSLPTIVSL
jgi:hypothetical protein